MKGICGLDLRCKLALLLVSAVMVHNAVLSSVSMLRKAPLLLGKMLPFPSKCSPGCELSPSAAVGLIYSPGTDHHFPGQN